MVLLIAVGITLAGRAFAVEGAALIGVSPQVSDLGDLQLVLIARLAIVDLIPPFLLAPRDGAQPGA